MMLQKKKKKTELVATLMDYDLSRFLLTQLII